MLGVIGTYGVDGYVPAQSTPSVNEGVRKVTRGFRWESEAQHHIPTIEIEFDPVSTGVTERCKGLAGSRPNCFQALTGGQAVIKLTDIDGKTHAIHPDAIARLVEPGSSGKWHGINCYVRTFDGDTIEVREKRF